MTFGPPLFCGLGFGAWAVGGGEWGGDAAADARDRAAAVARALERGVTVFDTAPAYGAGESERLLGAILKPARDRVAIATKVGPRDDARRSLEASLRRLDSDYVDLVQLHETLDGWEQRLETLETLRGEGKARAIGVCNATHLQLARALEIAPIASYQGPYNLFDRDAEQRELPLCKERGLAFLAYRPLAAGLLTGKYQSPPAFPEGDHRAKIYWFKGAEFERRRHVIEEIRVIAERHQATVAAVSLAWALARPGVTVVLAGARTAAQVDANLTATALPLNPEEIAAIDGAVDSAFRLPRPVPALADQAASWGERERFIVERLDPRWSPERIAAAWTDRGAQPMIAAQVKVFVDQLARAELVR